MIGTTDCSALRSSQALRQRLSSQTTGPLGPFHKGRTTIGRRLVLDDLDAIAAEDLADLAGQEAHGELADIAAGAGALLLDLRASAACGRYRGHPCPARRCGRLGRAQPLGQDVEGLDLRLDDGAGAGRCGILVGHIHLDAGHRKQAGLDRADGTGPVRRAENRQAEDGRIAGPKNGTSSSNSICLPRSIERFICLPVRAIHRRHRISQQQSRIIEAN